MMILPDAKACTFHNGRFFALVWAFDPGILLYLLYTLDVPLRVV